MQISLSAGGTPATVRDDLKRQAEQQLAGRKLEVGAPELTEALLVHVGRQLEGVPHAATVSVSAHLFVSVSKPIDTTASAELVEAVAPAAPAAAEPPAPSSPATGTKASRRGGAATAIPST